MIDFAVVLLPVVIAAIVFFARAPEAGTRFSVGLRALIAVLCVLTAAAAWLQQRQSAEGRRGLIGELRGLRTVSALRKQTADLSKELLDFYHQREHYNDRFKPGQGLSDEESRDALKWYAETVSLYHSRFESRVVSVLQEIRAATGVDAAALESDARSVRFAPAVEEIANRLSAVAASLP